MKLNPLASKIDVMSPDFSGSGDVVRPDESFDRMVSALPSDVVPSDPGKSIELDRGNVADAVEETASIAPELRLLGQILLQTPVPQAGAQSTSTPPLYPSTTEGNGSSRTNIDLASNPALQALAQMQALTTGSSVTSTMSVDGADRRPYMRNATGLSAAGSVDPAVAGSYQQSALTIDTEEVVETQIEVTEVNQSTFHKPIQSHANAAPLLIGALPQKLSAADVKIATEELRSAHTETGNAPNSSISSALNRTEISQFAPGDGQSSLAHAGLDKDRASKAADPSGHEFLAPDALSEKASGAQLSASMQVSAALRAQLAEVQAVAGRGASSTSNDPSVPGQLSYQPVLRQLDLVLQPADLGRVTIKLRLAGPSLSISLGAESSTTRALLDKELERLKDDLSNSGYELDDVQIVDASASPLPAHLEESADRTEAGSGSAASFQRGRENAQREASWEMGRGYGARSQSDPNEQFEQIEQPRAGIYL